MPIEDYYTSHAQSYCSRLRPIISGLQGLELRTLPVDRMWKPCGVSSTEMEHTVAHRKLSTRAGSFGPSYAPLARHHRPRPSGSGCFAYAFSSGPGPVGTSPVAALDGAIGPTVVNNFGRLLSAISAVTRAPSGKYVIPRGSMIYLS